MMDHHLSSHTRHVSTRDLNWAWASARNRPRELLKLDTGSCTDTTQRSRSRVRIHLHWIPRNQQEASENSLTVKSDTLHSARHTQMLLKNCLQRQKEMLWKDLITTRDLHPMTIQLHRLKNRNHFDFLHRTEGAVRNDSPFFYSENTGSA